MVRTLARVLDACHLASCFFLVLLVLISTVDVIMRYLFASFVPDTIELSGMMLGLCISFALAPVTYSQRQVGLNVVRSVLSPTASLVSETLMRILIASIFGLMGWQAFIRASKSYGYGEYSGSMQIPSWPPKMVFAFACVLTAVSVLALSVKLVRTERAAPAIGTGE